MIRLGLVLILLIPLRSAMALEDVDLQLILSNDISSSMTAEAYLIQRDGLIRAFRDPEVQRTIARAGEFGKVAVYCYEWANDDFQRVRIPWMILHRERLAQDVELMVSTLLASTTDQVQAKDGTKSMRTTGFTAMGHALRFIRTTSLPGSPYHAQRTVIDVSGDGANNYTTVLPNVERDLLLEDESLTINGIVMPGNEKNVYEFYTENVIGGVGAFAINVSETTDYPTAIRRKLIQEIANRYQVPFSFAAR